MITVKCDMCGKDITNDTERIPFRFHHEETISDYDICGDCTNKIEEFIKVSYKHSCEPINPEEQEALDKWKKGLSKTAMFNKPEPDPCEEDKNGKSPLYSNNGYKLTEEEAKEWEEWETIHETFCEVRKEAIDKILGKNKFDNLMERFAPKED